MSGSPHPRKIDRRAFLAGTVSLVATPLTTEAQQAGKVYRLGILAPNASPALQSFRDTLHRLGYIEGQNLVIAARYDEGNPDRLPALAAELVTLKVDVILAATSTYVKAAKEATTNIPIIFAVHNDPIGTGDVVSLAHPGGNVTGLTLMATDLAAKQLEFLREAVPAMRRLVIIWNPSTPSHKPSLPEAMTTGRRLGMEMQLQEASNVSEFERAYEAAAHWHAHAVLILTSPVSFVERKRLAALTIEAGGPPRGTADEVRAHHQPQDRESPRPDDLAVAPAAGGSGDPVAANV